MNASENFYRDRVLSGIEPVNTVSSATEADFIAVLRDVVEVSDQLGIRTHIWGGLSIDIFEGRLLRPHHDIDGFIENLLAYNTKLIDAFSNRGYQVKLLEEFQILRVDKGYDPFSPPVLVTPPYSINTTSHQEPDG